MASTLRLRPLVFEILSFICFLGLLFNLTNDMTKWSPKELGLDLFGVLYKSLPLLLSKKIVLKIREFLNLCHNFIIFSVKL